MGTVAYSFESREWQGGGIGSQAWRDGSNINWPAGRRLWYSSCFVAMIYSAWQLNTLKPEDGNVEEEALRLRMLFISALEGWIAVGLLHNFHWFQTWSAFR